MIPLESSHPRALRHPCGAGRERARAERLALRSEFRFSGMLDSAVLSLTNKIVALEIDPK